MVGPQAADDCEIFVPGVGQYENIGDIILRRQLLRWLRPLGRLHVYIGRAHDGYEAALELSRDDVVYSSFARWYVAGLGAALGRSVHYVFKPGEIQLTLAGLKEHLAMVPLCALIRARGGSVLRIGSGTRNMAPVPRLLLMPSIMLANRVWWRDPGTAAYLGHGEVMPDLAFAEGDEPSTALASRRRDLLVVSMRGDRPMGGEAWIDGIRQFAGAHGLRIQVVTQVARDAPMSARLAAALEGDLLNWDGRAHAAQEARLRAVYRLARFAISDRLHVLIAAFSHGVIPVGALNDRSDKIARHFAAAGIEDIAFEAATLNAAGLAMRLERAAQTGAGALAHLPEVRERLQLVREQAAAVISRRTQHASKPRATP